MVEALEEGTELPQSLLLRLASFDWVEYPPRCLLLKLALKTVFGSSSHYMDWGITRAGPWELFTPVCPPYFGSIQQLVVFLPARPGLLLCFPSRPGGSWPLSSWREASGPCRTWPGATGSAQGTVPRQESPSRQVGLPAGPCTPSGCCWGGSGACGTLDPQTSSL